MKSKSTFQTFTGTFRGVPVTLVATGMGVPMMDFVVREIRHVVEGPMAVMRLGTCGVMNTKCTAGDIIVATEGSVFIQTNYDKLVDGKADGAYTISKPIFPDMGLAKVILENMKEIIGEENVKEGGNCSADSFYGSEGRNDPNFADFNDDLIDTLAEQFPACSSLEMETFKLLSLGVESHEDHKIYACGAAIGLIDRNRGQKMVSAKRQKELEDLGGLAILKALTEFDFPNGEPEGHACPLTKTFALT